MLRTCTMFSTGQQILLLDQFEEFFNYQRFREGFGDFVEELSAAVLDNGIPASFVFSMREDFALELNAFKEFLPGVFDNYFRLEKLTREQARLAIEKPLEKTDFRFESKKQGQKALLDRVLDDLAKREQERQFGVRELLELKELPLLVEPPHLQIVCRELWQHHRDDEVKQITHAAYEQAGRTVGILNNYFLGKISLFNKKEQQFASVAFDHLVGNRAIKIAHPLERLVELTHVDEEKLQPVLDRLQDYAVLRRQKRGDMFWYELYHDIFSESIDKWNRNFKNRQRLKRLAFGGVAVLVAGGLLFAGNNWRANYYGRYLASQEGVFDRIEVHQGTEHGLDLFRLGRFNYESPFLRQEVEADKRFDRSIVEDMENTRANLVGRLPLLERLPRYAEGGLYRRMYKNKDDEEDKLVEILLETGGDYRINPFQLVSVRTTKSTYLLCKAIEKQTVAYPVVAFVQLGNKTTLRRFLDNRSEGVRMSAAFALGKLCDILAVPKLIKLLEDESAEVRTSAASALGNLGDSSAVPKLIKLLEDEFVYVRESAASALGNLDDSSAVPKLIKLLEDESAEVRTSAAEILGNLSDSSAVPRLINLLEDEFVYVRESAASALGNLDDSSAAPALVKLLEDESADVRRSAVYALNNLGDSSAVLKLINLLEDEFVYVRESAASALNKLGDSSAAPALVKLLKDERQSTGVRTSAAEVLGNLSDRSDLSDSSTVRKLINLLEDEFEYVRESAAEILGNLGDSSAAPALVKLLEDEYADVRRSAVYALDNLGDSSAVPKLIKLLEDESVDVRESAAVVLGNLGDSSAAPELIKFLENPSRYSVWISAVYALANLGDSSVAPALVKFRADAFAVVQRANATYGLGNLSYISAVPELVKLLGDKPMELQGGRNSTAGLRKIATNVLGGLGDSSVAPEMIKLLEDESADVRLSAASSLGSLKIAATVLTLSKYLKYTKLRDTTAKALVRMNQFSPELRAWQDEQFKVAQKYFKNDKKQEAASALGFVFIEQSVSLLSSLLVDANSNVVGAAIESIGNIGEYHPGLVQAQTEQLLELTNNNNVNLHKNAITALGRIISFHGEEKSADRPELEQNIHTALRKYLFDPQEKFATRQAALDALGSTDRPDCAEEIYKLLKDLDKNKDESLRYRSLLWLGRMAYTDAYDYVEDELEDLEQEKADWRKRRDIEEPKKNSVTEVVKRKDKTWKKEHWEYMLGNALARIKPETTGIKLLNHPLYQVRQGTIRALASRIADGAADASLIGKIIQAHQNFDPDDLPSPFPYAAFRAIDLALWNLEYTGKKDDVTKLKEILKNLKPCKVPGQEGAIEERLEWTIKRLEENLAQNAKIAE